MSAASDFSSPRPTDEIVDVLIVGAGGSGAVVAWSLADTRMKILCLEQGDWVKPTEFPTNGDDWEARRYSDFHISPNRRAREADYPINDDNSLIKVANFNGVGGGTILYMAHFPRMHPSDFRVRTLDGVADDWPIDYWTLEPYFAANDRMMGVAGLTGDPSYPPHQPTMPPIPLGRSGVRYARALNKLGWHWWPSETALATVEHDGRAKCINLGQCTLGCAQGAKASVDITYWPHALRAKVELRTRCRVREIVTDEHGMAAGVVYYDANGLERFQPAEEHLAARFANHVQIFITTEEVVGDQRAPVFELSGGAHFLHEVQARFEVVAVAAVKIVVEEKHAAAFAGRENLLANVIELVSFITVAFGS